MDTRRDQSHHANGKVITDLGKVKRNDEAFYERAFPETETGKLLAGLSVEFLIKQEHRIGWARKSACDDEKLLLHPNETVASHMWGVSKLIMVLSKSKMFQEEMPEFDREKAFEMALLHDVAELDTSDFTPVDQITKEEKHKLECAAMDKIMGQFPGEIGESLKKIFDTYEDRKCIESKFVKDCDFLDFMLTAFVLERQGFSGIVEFYTNTMERGFHTKIATELARTLYETRNKLFDSKQLYKAN